MQTESEQTDSTLEKLESLMSRRSCLAAASAALVGASHFGNQYRRGPSQRA